MYLKQTAIANPHLTLHYKDPSGEEITYERNSKQMPPETIEIKPHPHGVELGLLIAMLKDTTCRSLSGFLREEFSRVGAKVAKDIIRGAGKGLSEKSYPSRIAREEAAALHHAIQATKISSPSTECIAPIGEDLLLKGLQKELEADFYVAATRPAAVYRGNPFAIEAGLAYGRGPEEAAKSKDEKKVPLAEGEQDKDDNELARVIRYANRVPLQYQQGACAITKAVTGTDWKSYQMQQPRGAPPVGPMLLMVHIASVWVPFTSESKEAIAHYPEIIKEIRLGLQECGRRVATFIRKRKREADEAKKRAYIEKYIPQVSIGLQQILELSDVQRDQITRNLSDVLERSRKM